MLTKKQNFRIFCLILLALVLVIAFLGVRNIVLKKQFHKLQKPSYVFDADELAKRAQKSNSKVVIVRNGRIGLWDRKEGSKKLKLIPELTIGESEGDPNKIFYRIGSVIADKDGNIYVCQIYDGNIKKFNPNGEYLMTIGGKGRGPAELLMPLFMAFDNSGNLCVLEYGNQRISKFSCSGKYLGSVRLNLPQIPFGGFAIDDTGAFYVSVWDREKDKVIHKFSSTGKFLGSFGKAVKFPTPLSPSDNMIKRDISRGRLAFFNKELYYSQRNPYEIRIFTTDGSLKMRIFRKNRFMPPSKVKIIGKETIEWKVPASSTFIGIWKDKIINAVSIPKYLPPKAQTVIDLFSMNGKLLTTLSLPEEIWLYYLDAVHERIYGTITDENGIKKVVRFRLSLQEL